MTVNGVGGRVSARRAARAASAAWRAAQRADLGSGHGACDCEIRDVTPVNGVGFRCPACDAVADAPEAMLTDKGVGDVILVTWECSCGSGIVERFTVGEAVGSRSS
jgi:hypothetical protein